MDFSIRRFCHMYPWVYRIMPQTWWRHQMETFSVTGPLCREFTDHRWIPLTKASDAELWYFLWPAPWINSWVKAWWCETQSHSLGRHCNGIMQPTCCAPFGKGNRRVTIRARNDESVPYHEVTMVTEGEIAIIQTLWKSIGRVFFWIHFQNQLTLLHRAASVEAPLSNLWHHYTRPLKTYWGN